LAAAPARVRAAYSVLPKRESVVTTLRQWKTFLITTQAAIEEEIVQLRKAIADRKEDGYPSVLADDWRLDALCDTLDAVVNGKSMQSDFPLLIAQANLPAAVLAHKTLGTEHIGKHLAAAKVERDKHRAVIDEWLETLPTPPTSKHVLRQTTAQRNR